MDQKKPHTRTVKFNRFTFDLWAHKRNWSMLKDQVC